MIPLTQTAIAGIAETEYSRNSGRSEMALAAEASLSAIGDAGLTPEDIDGLVCPTFEANDQLELQRTLGIPHLRYVMRVPFGGGGGNATVLAAAAAVASGAAKAVLIHRSMNGFSERRIGRPESAQAWGQGDKTFDHHYSFKLNTAGKSVSLVSQEYMARYGVGSEDLGRYVVATRDFAATNPRALYYNRPLTLEEHQASRWIVEPYLRRWDCAIEADGANALVITGLDHARDLKQPVVRVLAATQHHFGGRRIAYDLYHTDEEKAAHARQLNADLHAMSGIRPHEADVAMIYDAFTPIAFTALEEFGFCGPGEAKDFIADGHTGRGGSKPVNPNGGFLGEAYIHSVNNILEAVRQVRGQAANQVADVRSVLVSGGGALMLGKP